MRIIGCNFFLFEWIIRVVCFLIIVLFVKTPLFFYIYVLLLPYVLNAVFVVVDIVLAFLYK